MTQLDIYHNYNGKLFCDFFSFVTIYTPMYYEGQEVELIHRSSNMGTANVVRIMTFPFYDLKDSVSYLHMGKPAQYLAAALNKQHNYGNTIERNEKVMHMIIGWAERNMEVQNDLMKEWWQLLTPNS